MDIHFIDTHTHLDGEEFKEDLAEVIARAKETGVSKVFLPGIDLNLMFCFQEMIGKVLKDI
jgi:TatD DNase family protein